MTGAPPARVFAPLPALEAGSPIRVVAPSGPFEREPFERGVARLAERYDVRVGPGVYAREGFLAGDDARRLAELWDALEEPDTRAIVCARGGHGATRLLDRVPSDRVRRARKLLVGFSDVTALHALWARAGLRSLHAPMVAGLGRATPEVLLRFVAALEGAGPEAMAVEALVPGAAEGPLLGGNLAVLCALLGTPYAPPLDGAVLFLEDIGERPYRVDRMFTQLASSGVFDSVVGVVVGHFNDCVPGPDGVTVDSVIRERLSRVRVPVALGVPSGHVDDNLELPFGAPVRLDADRGELQFLAPAVTSAKDPP